MSDNKPKRKGHKFSVAPILEFEVPEPKQHRGESVQLLGSEMLRISLYWAATSLPIALDATMHCLDRSGNPIDFVSVARPHLKYLVHHRKKHLHALPFSGVGPRSSGSEPLGSLPPQGAPRTPKNAASNSDAASTCGSYSPRADRGDTFDLDLSSCERRVSTMCLSAVLFNHGVPLSNLKGLHCRIEKLSHMAEAADGGLQTIANIPISSVALDEQEDLCNDPLPSGEKKSLIALMIRRVHGTLDDNGNFERASVTKPLSSSPTDDNNDVDDEDSTHHWKHFWEIVAVDESFEYHDLASIHEVVRQRGGCDPVNYHLPVLTYPLNDDNDTKREDDAEGVATDDDEESYSFAARSVPAKKQLQDSLLFRATPKNGDPITTSLGTPSLRSTTILYPPPPAFPQTPSDGVDLNATVPFSRLLQSVPRLVREGKRQYNVGRSAITEQGNDMDSSDDEAPVVESMRALVPMFDSATVVRFDSKTYNVGSAMTTLKHHYEDHREEYETNTVEPSSPVRSLIPHAGSTMPQPPLPPPPTISKMSSVLAVGDDGSHATLTAPAAASSGNGRRRSSAVLTPQVRDIEDVTPFDNSTSRLKPPLPPAMQSAIELQQAKAQQVTRIPKSPMDNGLGGSRRRMASNAGGLLVGDSHAPTPFRLEGGSRRGTRAAVSSFGSSSGFRGVTSESRMSNGSSGMPTSRPSIAATKRQSVVSPRSGIAVPVTNDTSAPTSALGVVSSTVLHDGSGGIASTPRIQVQKEEPNPPAAADNSHQFGRALSFDSNTPLVLLSNKNKEPRLQQQTPHAQAPHHSSLQHTSRQDASAERSTVNHGHRTTFAPEEQQHLPSVFHSPSPTTPPTYPVGIPSTARSSILPTVFKTDHTPAARCAGVLMSGLSSAPISPRESSGGAPGGANTPKFSRELLASLSLPPPTGNSALSSSMQQADPKEGSVSKSSRPSFSSAAQHLTPLSKLMGSLTVLRTAAKFKAGAEQARKRRRRSSTKHPTMDTMQALFSGLFPSLNTK